MTDPNTNQSQQWLISKLVIVSNDLTDPSTCHGQQWLSPVLVMVSNDWHPTLVMVSNDWPLNLSWSAMTDPSNTHHSVTHPGCDDSVYGTTWLCCSLAMTGLYDITTSHRCGHPQPVQHQQSWGTTQGAQKDLVTVMPWFCRFKNIPWFHSKTHLFDIYKFMNWSNLKL